MAESKPNRTSRYHEEEEGEGKHMLFYNPSRHEHELCLFEGLPAYKCSGCKEYGANLGYKCKDAHSSSCKNFTLHEACAVLPDEFQHSSRRPFKFLPKTHLRHHCDACRDVVKGFVFEAEKPHHLRLHPLCMDLPERLHYSGHEQHQLKFVTGDLKGEEYGCTECRKNISGGWRYRCEDVRCQVTVDLSCAKIDFYGLSNSGIARVAPMSRSRRLRSKLSSSGKWITSTLFEGTVSGVLEAVISEAVDLSCAKIDFYDLSNSGIGRVAPMSRSRRLRSKFSSSGKSFASTLFEGIVSGVVEAVISEAVN